jgi:hypothetical protein
LTGKQPEKLLRKACKTDHKSSATPVGVEYYTPYGGTGLTPGSDHCSPGWSPLSRVPTFHEILQNSKNNETFSAQILKYDQGAEPVAIVEVKCQRLASVPDEEPPKHEFHYCGALAVIGRGRFSKRQKASQLLWQASNMAVDMQSRMHLPQTFQNQTIPSHQPVNTNVPQFWICSRSDDHLKSNVQRIIGFVKTDSVFQNLLGLTRSDAEYWVNDWLQMSSAEGPLVESVANHLFGDTLLAYPKMCILNILVKFYTSSPVRKPILLRISIGQDPRPDILDCPHCFKTFQQIDYIGPHGAAKLHISSPDDPRPHTTRPHRFRSLADFAIDNTTKRSTAHTKWSQIAYLYQGWSQSPLLVACECENKLPKNLASQHFINVWNEKVCEEDNDVFDPSGESIGDSAGSFEPYPQEGRFLLTVDCYSESEDEDEEDSRWDPYGDAGSENGKEFEPSPPDEHGQKYLSPAVRLAWM